MATQMSISVTDEQRRMCEDEVLSGRYQNSSEVVRDALRMFMERREERTARLASIHSRLDSAVDQIQAGQVVDGKDVIAAMRSKHRSRRSQ